MNKAPGPLSPKPKTPSITVMETVLQAQLRPELGRGPVRKLRREGRIPGVVYGDGPARPVSFSAREIAVRLQEEAFHSTVVTLEVDGKKVSALLREAQSHPVRREILHVDFQAVRADQEIAARAPLHFLNQESCPGVKLRHGIFTAIENEIGIHGLPRNLPEFIEVDVAQLDIGKTIHLSEIPVPKGIRFDALVRGDDPALARVVERPAEEVEETAAEAEAAAATEGEAATTEGESQTEKK